MQTVGAHLFRFMQLPSDFVDVHDTLRRIPVADDLGVELAESYCFLLCQSILCDERVYFLQETVVRLLVLLCLG